MPMLPEPDVIPQSVQTGIAVFLTLLLVVGVLGNLLTIYVIAAKRKLRTSPNVFVANLAVSDIVLLAVNLPTNIWEFFYGDAAAYEKTYCKYTSPINIMTMICSLTSVAGVGLNRYLLLCMNKSTYMKCSKKSSIVLFISLIWVWSFLITTPPMFGFGEFGYHEKFHTCFFKAYDEESWLYGTIFCCVLGVFPPVLASTFFYGKILLKLRSNRQNLLKHYNKSSPKKTDMNRYSTDNISSFNSSASCIKDSQELSQSSNDLAAKSRCKNAMLLRRNAQQRRSIMMLVTVFIIIVICWLPISVSFIVDRRNKLPSIVYVSFVILAWFNSCVNIFIYAGMNQQFRRCYKGVLMSPFVKAKHLVSITSEVATISESKPSTVTPDNS